MNIEAVLAVAAASPTTTDDLTVLGYLMTRLVEQGDPGAAAAVLTEPAAIVERADLTPKQQNRLANKLRTPIRTVMRSAPLGLQRELLAGVPALPQTCARMVVTAAAQENFTALRPDLAALLEQEVPHGVGQQIHDDIRIRSRTFAVGPLPRLVKPLQG